MPQKILYYKIIGGELTMIYNMETLVIGIALLSYLFSFLFLGLCYKYVEKHPVSEAKTATGLIFKKIILLLIFIVPGLMLGVPLFICIESFPMLIIGIYDSYKKDCNPFIMNQVAAYIIQIISMISLFISINVLYNSIFKNCESKLYKMHHSFFGYFYENPEGLSYKTKIYAFWFMILIRIILPLFVSTFILSILTV